MQASDKPYIDIELFPCAGGMGEGHRRAGVVFDLMIEIEETHCDSYEANLGHRPVQMDARSFLEMLQSGWRPPKPVRYLCADPPCTPWSRAGKRMGQDDPRDMLDGTCRIIALLRPEVYLIGNVPGLDDGPNLPIVQKTIGNLSRHGYCTADFARLDAANYSVPQHRVRPFWFGHLQGPCIQWPQPTHGDPSECQNLTLPGIRALLPWVSCAQALGHLSAEDLGRPIKLRHRSQNGVQQGSAPEAPARVVGTSNLSDGNVLIPPDAPRSGSKKRRRDEGRVPQSDRVNVLDEPSATVTRNGGRARMGAASTLLLTHPEPSSAGKRKRDEGRIPQANRVRDAERPSAAITCKPARKGAGESSTITVNAKDHIMSRDDRPARTLTRNTHGDGSVIVRAEPSNNEMFPPSSEDKPSNTIRAQGREAYLIVTGKHPTFDPDDPAYTIRGGGDGHSAPHYILANDRHPNATPDAPAPTLGAKQRSQGAQVIQSSDKHPASPNDGPAMTVRGSSGAGVNRAVEWPWERPATTVQGDPRLAPIGHHGPSFMSDANAVVISEKAAAILQGFPDGWIFCGDSKKARWSQIGQAMPPPLAHAVAESVVEQISRTDKS